MRRPLGWLSVPAAVATALSVLQSTYLCALMVAALVRSERPRPTPTDDLRLVVLIPAHDEAAMITDTVRALLDCDYHPDRREVIVIADNCSDATASLARSAGATAWERDDPSHRGKGSALAWALARLSTERADADAIVMVDADCTADQNLLAAVAGYLSAGADAVQTSYVASNPDASSTAALRFAGFALMNVVRPSGKDALGVSCGLMGTGMGFTARTLATHPWSAFSVTEDKEQHLRMLLDGVRVRFVGETAVRSPVPLAQAQADTQQVRWETGNVELARRWIPRLLRRGVQHRDPEALHAAWELLVPPLSLVAAPIPIAWTVGRLGGRRALRRLAELDLILLSAYVFGGLRLVEAPKSVYRALLTAPVLIVRRVVQYSSLAGGGGHDEWQRSSRDGLGSAPPER